MWRVGDHVIERPIDGYLDEARAFCNKAYLDHGYLNKESVQFPAHFYTLRLGEQMHGTIGVYLPEDLDGMPFPTEYVYDFRLADVGIDPSTVGEVSRLSGNGRTFAATIAWMANHMYENLGLQYAMFGVKPFIREGLTKMGIPSVEHGCVGLPKLDRVPPEFLPYFTQDPPPIVVTVDLFEAQRAVKAHLIRMAA